ncbi:unnamed protein product, partial [Mesorhabditis belari]|uniref:PFU domain-containing protein n=1 Tax=Mesorhabditis belari TaxID=2138241 RepID=A0AAF3EEW9_9BILA
MTGSWDKTCVVFSIKEMDNESPQILRLVGQAQILAVHSLPEKDLYLTAGSDRVIRFWKKDTEIRQFTGHKDVVRALSVRSNEQFISASNDSTIRIWDIESGACIGKISSNFDSYIYSLTSLGDKLVTTSEGGYIEIWEPQAENKLLFQNQQIIKTPAQSIWDACFMLNGDLVTAGSDGRIYVWTTNEKRKAPQAIIEALDAALAAQTAKEAEIAEKQAGGKVVIKVALDDGAPSLELIYEKGTDPSIAAEKFIRDNDLPISYLSEITEYIKANIPEARAAVAAKMKPQETQRVEVDGEKWDYAFDISVDDGRKLRLCYNTGEDVDYAAQRFVEKYNLPMKFLAQISTFLRQQMTEAGATKGYTDPYTGGSSYVPESQTNIGGSVADPFTGEGRYIPSSFEPTPMDISSGDPLTSGGRAKNLRSQT